MRKRMVPFEDGGRILQMTKHLMWDSSSGHIHFWGPCTGGIVLQHKNQLLRNGRDVIYKGKWHSWKPHPKGPVVRIKDKFLLNGTELMYQGNSGLWAPTWRGIVSQEGKKLLLNGTELLCEGEFDFWQPHDFGVVTRKDGRFLLNGKELLWEGEFDIYDGWGSFMDGIIIRKGNQFIYYDPASQGRGELVYEGKLSSFQSLSNDLVIRLGNLWTIIHVVKRGLKVK